MSTSAKTKVVRATRSHFPIFFRPPSLRRLRHHIVFDLDRIDCIATYPAVEATQTLSTVFHARARARYKPRVVKIIFARVFLSNEPSAEDRASIYRKHAPVFISSLRRVSTLIPPTADNVAVFCIRGAEGLFRLTSIRSA